MLFSDNVLCLTNSFKSHEGRPLSHLPLRQHNWKLSPIIPLQFIYCNLHSILKRSLQLNNSFSDNVLCLTNSFKSHEGRPLSHLPLRQHNWKLSPIIPLQFIYCNLHSILKRSLQLNNSFNSFQQKHFFKIRCTTFWNIVALPQTICTPKWSARFLNGTVTPRVMPCSIDRILEECALKIMRCFTIFKLAKCDTTIWEWTLHIHGY